MKIFLKLILLILLLDRTVVAAEIRGRVIDGISRAPLSGFTVSDTAENYGDITDDSGYFSILDMPAGRYMLSISGLFEHYFTFFPDSIDVSLIDDTVVNIEFEAFDKVERLRHLTEFSQDSLLGEAFADSLLRDSKGYIVEWRNLYQVRGYFCPVTYTNGYGDFVELGYDSTTGLPIYCNLDASPADTYAGKSYLYWNGFNSRIREFVNSGGEVRSARKTQIDVLSKGLKGCFEAGLLTGQSQILRQVGGESGAFYSPDKRISIDRDDDGLIRYTLITSDPDSARNGFLLWPHCDKTRPATLVWSPPGEDYCVISIDGKYVAYDFRNGRILWAEPPYVLMDCFHSRLEK